MLDAAGGHVYFAAFALNRTRYAVEVQTFSVNPLSPPEGYTLPTSFPAGGTSFSWNAVLTFPASFNHLIGYAAGFSTDANLSLQASGISPNGGTVSGSSTIAYLSTTAPQIQPNPVVLVSMTGVQNKYSLAPIIYSFTSGGVAAGALISERPSSLDYIAPIPGQYSELRITLLGTDFLPLQMQDGNISIMLLIKENVSP